MSKFAVLETQIREQCHLVEALQEMGFTVESHTEPQTLYGYRGDARPEKANVIVRRQFVGQASNDVGFVSGANGVFRAIISEYDAAIGYDQKWLGRVAQLYKEKQTIATARKKGYLFQGKETIQTDRGQQIRLKFAVR